MGFRKTIIDRQRVEDGFSPYGCPVCNGTRWYFLTNIDMTNYEQDRVVVCESCRRRFSETEWDLWKEIQEIEQERA